MSMRKFRYVFRALMIAGLAALGWLLPLAANAQTADEIAGARASAQSGAKAFEAGNYQEALDLFSRAESLVHAPPHLLWQARAHEKLGQLVQARELYIRLQREELAPDAPPAFVEAKEAADAELEALEPRLAQLTISIKQPAPEGIQVVMDGKEVATALIGVPRPANPGDHELHTTIRGVEGPSQNVTLVEGGRQSIELEPPDPSLIPPEEEKVEPVPDTAPATVDDKRGMRIGAYVAIGVGVVGAGLGTLFLLQGSSAQSDADSDFDACNPTRCTQQQHDDIVALDEDAASAKTLSAVSFGLGGAALATGAILLVLTSSKSAEVGPEQASVTPFFGINAAGVRGRF